MDEEATQGAQLHQVVFVQTDDNLCKSIDLYSGWLSNLIEEAGKRNIQCFNAQRLAPLLPEDVLITNIEKIEIFK
tara:strand:- start:54897 stop:55121 length:225 start_codon:yes stop_codon:yes gene_type:complete